MTIMNINIMKIIILIMIMLMIIMKTILIFISRARRKLIGGAALSAEKIALNCPEVGSDMV